MLSTAPAPVAPRNSWHFRCQTATTHDRACSATPPPARPRLATLPISTQRTALSDHPDGAYLGPRLPFFHSRVLKPSSRACRSGSCQEGKPILLSLLSLRACGRVAVVHARCTFSRDLPSSAGPIRGSDLAWVRPASRSAAATTIARAAEEVARNPVWIFLVFDNQDQPVLDIGLRLSARIVFAEHIIPLLPPPRRDRHQGGRWKTQAP